MSQVVKTLDKEKKILRICSVCTHPFCSFSIEKYHMNSPGFAEHRSKAQAESNHCNP